MAIWDGRFFRRVPVVTICTMLTLAICFVLEQSMQAFVYPSRISPYLSVSRPFIAGGHFMRLLTASFFHVNPSHFISNILGLIFTLILLEYAAGSWRALIVVLVSALGGAVGSVVFEWVGWMVGASTILFGVYGALGILIFRYRKEMGRLFALIAVIWLVILAGSVMGGYASLKIVDQGAHIGGFLAGAAVMFIGTHGRSWKELANRASLRMKSISLTLVTIFGFGLFQVILTIWPLLRH